MLVYQIVTSNYACNNMFLLLKPVLNIHFFMSASPWWCWSLPCRMRRVAARHVEVSTVEPRPTLPVASKAVTDWKRWDDFLPQIWDDYGMIMGWLWMIFDPKWFTRNDFTQQNMGWFNWFNWFNWFKNDKNLEQARAGLQIRHHQESEDTYPGPDLCEAEWQVKWSCSMVYSTGIQSQDFNMVLKAFCHPSLNNQQHLFLVRWILRGMSPDISMARDVPKPKVCSPQAQAEPSKWSLGTVRCRRATSNDGETGRPQLSGMPRFRDDSPSKKPKNCLDKFVATSATSNSMNWSTLVKHGETIGFYRKHSLIMSDHWINWRLWDENVSGCRHHSGEPHPSAGYVPSSSCPRHGKGGNKTFQPSWRPPSGSCMIYMKSEGQVLRGLLLKT